ncbi:hypothetical protein ERO13_A01G093050v2 [Gossypium hirsutum]|uniref:Uncharacterized protein n=1 Tax=Gossypium darwinii TaxID=34276 RepID=A0A5D2HJX8_GOSDA|nr:hypothetical protein ERO13_A01G093050v2 [Gossypium hirsutum]TYH30523.1 hypothetical protein ES288_A01G102000v1 [Gossypium darwinii]
MTEGTVPPMWTSELKAHAVFVAKFEDCFFGMLLLVTKRRRGCFFIIFEGNFGLLAILT